MSNILVVAAHPDDEVLGVGATVAKHIQNGDIVNCVILGEGQTSRWDRRELVQEEIIDELHQDTINAAKILGYSHVEFLDFPDNRFDRMDLLDIIKAIEKQIQKFQPEVVYTHHYGDLNIDHQITFKAVLTATRPVNNCIVKEIYAFETLSSTEWNFAYGDNLFRPNVFVDIEEFFQKKLQAIQCYHSELGEFPHPRSIKGIEILAQKWGSVVGKNYVEAFELIRKIS